MTLDRSIAFLLLANMLPVVGVFFWEWDIFALLFLFWCENAVIGLFGVLRVWVFAARNNQAGGFFLGAFFLVHYGGFMFGHLMVLLSLFADRSTPELKAISNIDFLSGFVDKWIGIGIAGLFLSHAWSFVENYLGKQEYQLLSVAGAMAMPYKRMAITHVALIVGGMLLVSRNEPLMGLLVLLGMKIALDVVFHQREHKQLDLAV